MVPDKFNMVDMGGIDLITMQGEEVEGLYDKLVESIAQCRYQCLYNWYFNDVLIPPTYVSMSIEDDSVIINSGVSVDSNDIINIYSLRYPPVIDSLSITENGEYEVPSGVDGYNPVSVNVQPEIEPLSVTENGTYMVPENVDGYNPVSVNVPQPTPIIESLSVTENGTYTPDEGVSGFSPVVVSVPTSPPDPRTLLASWDFTGSTPLVDSVSGKLLTNNGITFSSLGAFFARYGNNGMGEGQKINLVISGSDLLGESNFYGVDVELDIGSWNKYYDTGTDYSIRLILVTSQNGLAYRGNQDNSLRGWSFYDVSWSSNRKRSPCIEFSKCKLSFAYLNGVDEFYVNGFKVCENNTGNKLASSAEFLMIGAPTTAPDTSLGTCVGDIYIRALRVYRR